MALRDLGPTALGVTNLIHRALVPNRFVAFEVGSATNTDVKLKPGTYDASLNIDVTIKYGNDDLFDCPMVDDDRYPDAADDQPKFGPQGCVTNRTYAYKYNAQFTVRCFERAPTNLRVSITRRRPRR